MREQTPFTGRRLRKNRNYSDRRNTSPLTTYIIFETFAVFLQILAVLQLPGLESHHRQIHRKCKRTPEYGLSDHSKRRNRLKNGSFSETRWTRVTSISMLLRLQVTLLCTWFPSLPAKSKLENMCSVIPVILSVELDVVPRLPAWR